MNKREELLKEKERIQEIKKIMKIEGEEVFKNFRPKYQYKVKKIDLDKKERIFHRGKEIHTFIRLDIIPFPGVMHEYTGLHLKARKISPYTRLNLPVLFTLWQTFLVDEEGKIIQYDQSYGYEFPLMGRSICIEPLMKIWVPYINDNEKEKIEIIVERHRQRIIKIENWIKEGYPDNELVWAEEIETGEIIMKES